jgi:putative transposase
MKTSQHTAEQIISILEPLEKGDQTIAAVCRTHGIAENTFYWWRKASGGMAVNEVQRVGELEQENARLKRLLAERLLEIELLKEFVKKRLTLAEQRETVEFLAAGGMSVQRACVLAQLDRSIPVCRASDRCGADLAGTVRRSDAVHRAWEALAKWEGGTL